MKIQYPSSIDPYRAAVAHHQKKEYAEAKKLYLAVLRQQPQRAEAWVNLASVCDALGEREALIRNG
jgi:tetratricopeptide (TPR) repeat protein